MSATEVHSSGNEREETKMKPVNYQGSYKLKVDEVAKLTTEHPDDVIVKITTADTTSQNLFPVMHAKQAN